MRLLLVEDDPMVGKGLQQGLKKNGYTVDWVQDGIAASLALETTPYALLLLDLGLPRRDGMSVLKTLRLHNEILPAIIITARDALSDRVNGLNIGADDYIVKPFALEELLARINAVCRRQSGRAATELVVGAIRLDPVRHMTWFHGQPISLSVREFAILHELMREPYAVLSREQLEDRLYGWGEELSSNVIEVHISNLRKRLDPEVIHTIRGVGYRIGEGK